MKNTVHHPIIISRLLNRLLFIILCLSFAGLTARATHNRAGEIVFRHVSGYTYEFTLTVFAYTGSPVDRRSLDIRWGDNSVSSVPRAHQEVLPDSYYRNVYTALHTFPGSGVYTISVEDPNRNFGVSNIPNSGYMVFSLSTVFRIDPNLGANNAPQLLVYPIDKAAVGQVFVHNPSAYDADGDSLSYELTVPTREKNTEIEGYSLPEASDSIVMNAVTGDLIWASPVQTGIYNIAIKLFEWRNGIRQSSITRDMQIEVVNTSNRPPVISQALARCVEAGTVIDCELSATDPDNDHIQMTASGGPFQVYPYPAEFTVVHNTAGSVTAHFRWPTDLTHVRKQPYTVTVRAEDQNTDVKLVAFTHFDITVLAPKVNDVKAVAARKSIMLTWDASRCTHASGYEIYRSIGSSAVDPDSCAGGIPANSSYVKVGEVSGRNTLLFEDTNQGKGLSPGTEYCYRVVTVFSDGAKSFPSDESCATLASGMPPLIMADVVVIDENDGQIQVAWLRRPLDKLLDGKTGPFQYRLYRQTGAQDGERTLLYKTDPPNTQLIDTLFTDEHLNTLTVYPYYYTVELWNMETGNEFLMEENETASTLYPELAPTDKAITVTFGRYTPWINTRYEIYRCSKPAGDTCLFADFVYTGTASGESYTDTGLTNGQRYCYRIESAGYRLIDSIRYETVNRSHIACSTPLDNEPPCAPELAGTSRCTEIANYLEWTFNPQCMNDVRKFNIYFSSGEEPVYTLLDTVTDRNILHYLHAENVRGCYYVTATDSADNESPASNTVCLDECGAYELPNVFTPNGDNINDVFKSYNPADVRKVNMQIFNRWGKLVFRTEDAAINWDGRDMDGKRFVPSGVYYYTCDVYEERLTGLQIKTLTGFIHLYYNENAVPYEQWE
ncbi:MAG: gliding motility-associated C-terminal domain-containing protein [Bacteroidales bacterium]|jgi:gliding motility-associated-like protein|nr:gliding motility-associated C-terminal domain-containing protein [Bacteroidales bacterium]